MELQILTWNGININDGSVFRSSIPVGGMSSFRANPISVPRANDFPFLSRTMLPQHMFSINVDVLPGNSISAKREILKGYFNPLDPQRHNLIAQDTSDSNRQWYLTGFPVAFSHQTKVTWTITLAVETPAWRLVTAGTNTWNITATGQTNAVTNLGNLNVAPSFAITPTSAKTGGLSYRRWVPIYNNLDVTWNFPFDITGGGFDTATLTTAKMQADGDDFRVWMDGAEVERWLNAMDTAATKCWINLYLSPRHEGALAANLANNSSDVTVTFSQDAANKSTLEWLSKAPNRIFIIGSEAFFYESASVDIVAYQITSCKRAQKGTSAASHTAGATIRHIEHDLWILYGDSTLSAPVVDDDNKPIFDLSSTNATLSYSNYFDITANRPGAWSGGVSSSLTDLSYAYTADSNTFADVSTELGVALVGSQSAYNTMRETGTVYWSLTHPSGFTSITYSGSKYAANSFPEVCGLQYLKENTAWFSAENIVGPTTLFAWTSFGPSTVSLSSPYPTSVRFVLDGSLSPATSEIALAQFDTVSATVDSTKLPTTSIGAEQSMYLFDLKLTNNSSTYIKVKVPCALNQVLTIDCDNKQASLSDGGRALVFLSSNRDAWLDLISGSNTLKFDDTGTNAVTIVTTHRDKTL